MPTIMLLFFLTLMPSDLSLNKNLFKIQVIYDNGRQINDIIIWFMGQQMMNFYT